MTVRTKSSFVVVLVHRGRVVALEHNSQLAPKPRWCAVHSDSNPFLDQVQHLGGGTCTVPCNGHVVGITFVASPAEIIGGGRDHYRRRWGALRDTMV